MNIVEENWEQILNKMKLEYCSSNISYNTWIAPLTVYEVTDDTVYILVKLRASLEHIEEKYLLPFKVCIAEVTGYEYEVRACKKALEEGKIECPEMPHAETVRIMEIMDGLRKSWGYEIPEVE